MGILQSACEQVVALIKMHCLDWDLGFLYTFGGSLDQEAGQSSGREEASKGGDGGEA